MKGGFYKGGGAGMGVPQTGSLDTSEIGYLDALTPGTLQANKAVVVDSNSSIDNLIITGSSADALRIGAFSGATQGSGIDLGNTSAAMRCYADDGGAAIGSGSFVRAGVFRHLLTYTGGNREQEAGGVVGQVVSVAGTNRHNMAGTWGSYEARTSLTVGGQAAATDTWCQAGVLGRVGSQTASIITIDTNGVLAGVAAMSNVPTGFASNSGVFTAFYAGAWASAVDWAYGMYLEGGKFTTGIAIGSCTTGITVTSASGYALDIQTTGQVRMGIQGTGIPTATATPFAFELHAETGSDLTAGTTGLTCGLRCRYEVSVDQTNQISFEAIDARLRPKKDLADGNHCGINGTIEASESGTVFSGTSTTVRSGGFFSLDFDANVSITSGWLCGVTIDSSVHGNVSMASCTFCGLRIKTSSSKEVWEYGLYIDADSCVDGIYLGATTKACEMVVSALPADARGARFAFTCATPAMADGYGAHEIDLTVTGAATAAIAASSTWVNLPSGATTFSGGYCHVKNDGIWDGGATLTGTSISMQKFQAILAGSGFGALHIFELNFNQVITSMFNCNDSSKALGFVAGSPSQSAIGKIPFMTDGGGAVKYIYIYSS